MPSLDTILESGDRIRVVSRRENIETISKFFGDSIRSISETDFLSLSLGVVPGMHTQPACLAYANRQASNETPNVWYAAVYPASMIAKIILAQLIVSMLLVT